jgi:hypothetical protein
MNLGDEVFVSAKKWEDDHEEVRIQIEKYVRKISKYFPIRNEVVKLNARHWQYLTTHVEDIDEMIVQRQREVDNIYRETRGEEEMTNTSLHMGGGVHVSVVKVKGNIGVDIRRWNWRNDHLRPSKEGIFLEQSQWDILKVCCTNMETFVPELKSTLPCEQSHQNLEGAIMCSFCNPYSHLEEC